MIRNPLLSFTFLSLLLMPTFFVRVSTAVDWHEVSYVTDGDTLVLDNGGTVRLIGVDAPEVIDEYGRNPKMARWTSIDVEVIDDYASRAKYMVEEWARDVKVYLEFDPANTSIRHRDKYGRLLAYVYRESDNNCLNAELIRQGYALVYRRFSFEHRGEYLRLEKDAKESGRGFWRYRK